MNEIDKIIIKIEDDKNLQDSNDCLRSALSGFAYAKYLRRREKYKGRIVFTSFLPIDYLLNQRQTHILTAIGHTYLQMPYSEQELADILRGVNPLNDIQLKDIIINFCQERSAVRESFHAFKGRVREIASLQDPSVKGGKYREEFEKYRIELIKDVGDYPQIISEYDRIIAQYDEKKESSIELVESVTEESFVRFLLKDEDSTEENGSKKRAWKVLFLDDKPKELEAILNVLEERGIGYAVAESSNEAKVLIERDELNQIAVVVSDYRLVESTNREGWSKPKMQPEQGYDFLLWLSEQDRYNAMVALSGLSKWFLMDSFRQKQINVKVYSKNGLSGSGAKLFVDDLEHHGDRIYETILSLPTSSEWGKQLKNYYKWLRLECEDADKIEAYVQATAEGIINHLDEQLKLVDKIIDPKEKYVYLNLPDEMGEATTNLPTFFDPSKLDLFKLRLVYRRVLIYYLVSGTIKSNIVAKILNLGSANAIVYDNKNNVSADFEYEGMKKQVFSIQAIKEGDIPFNILIEEKLWLKNRMGMEILNAQVKINLLHDLLDSFFQQAKATVPNLGLLPEFKKAFTSGKSTSGINTDLSNLLKQLDATNKPLKQTLIKAIKPVLLQIRPLIHPINSYESLITTVNNHS